MKLMKNLNLIFAFGIIGLFVFSSCSGKGDERNAQDATSALVQQNQNIIAFGKVKGMDILNKVDYKHIPKANVLLGAQIQMWSKGFKTDAPIYYALEAPLAEDGTPATVFAMMDVTNKDSLVSVISEMGYAMEKAGEIEYFQENDVTFGVRNNLFILLSKKAPYDGKAAIEKAFTDSEGDLSEGKAAEILASEADIVNGISIERLYGTANTSLNKLSQAKKDELKELVADGFISSEVRFENGKASFESKNLFSDALKDRLFFSDNNGKTLVNKLGSGNAWMGVAANIDMRKFEKFVNDFAPDGNKKLTENLPGEAAFLLMALGPNAYSSMLSGQMGMVATGNPNAAFGMVFEFNAFLGLGKQGDSIRQMMEENLAGSPKKGDAYIMDNTAVAPRKDGIYIYSTTNTGKGKLTVPAYAKNFGEKTFSMFIAFDKMDIKSLELDDEMKVLEIMESFNASADRNGSMAVLTTKKKNANILKQVADFYVVTMKDKIDNLGI